MACKQELLCIYKTDRGIERYEFFFPKLSYHDTRQIARSHESRERERARVMTKTRLWCSQSIDP